MLGAQFEAETGIHPVFSFGSTAQLTQQIENGAPFDLFLAADAEHPQKLDGEGLLAKGSRVRLCDRSAGNVGPGKRARRRSRGLKIRPGADVHVIAIARPELAPYGRATVDASDLSSGCGNA